MLDNSLDELGARLWNNILTRDPRPEQSWKRIFSDASAGLTRATSLEGAMQAVEGTDGFVSLKNQEWSGRAQVLVGEIVATIMKLPPGSPRVEAAKLVERFAHRPRAA